VHGLLCSSIAFCHGVFFECECEMPSVEFLFSLPSWSSFKNVRIPHLHVLVAGCAPFLFLVSFSLTSFVSLSTIGVTFCLPSVLPSSSVSLSLSVSLSVRLHARAPEALDRSIRRRLVLWCSDQVFFFASVYLNGISCVCPSAWIRYRSMMR